MSSRTEASSSRCYQLNDLIDKLKLQKNRCTSKQLAENARCKGWSEVNPNFKEALSAMIAAAESISSCSTRLTLLFNSEDPSNIDLGIVEEMEKYCDHLDASFEVALAADSDACIYLQKRVIMITENIQSSLIELFSAMVSDTGGELNLSALTGIVWDACGATTALPKTNKNAIRLKLVDCSLSIKDIIDEFKERVSEVEEGDTDLDSSLERFDVRDGEAAAGGKYDDLVRYMEGEYDVFDAKEVECTKEVLSLLRLARNAVRLTSNLMLKASDLIEENDLTTTWAISVAFNMENVVHRSSDLGISLYSVMQQSSVLEAINAFEQVLSTCLSLLSRRTVDPADIRAVGEIREHLRIRIAAATESASKLEN